MLKKFCVVRTYSAGVHMGTVKKIDGTTVILKDARRLWKWEKAFTLNEVSQNGVGENSRISQVVPEIMLTECIEIIPCSDLAKENLSRTRNN